MHADIVTGVVVARDGSIWISNYHLLDVLRSGVVTNLVAGIDFPGEEVTAIYEDHAGRMWVGIDNGLTVYDGGRFKSILGNDGRPVGMIYVMQEDRQNNLWAIAREGRAGKVLRIRENRVVEEIPSSRFEVARIGAMAPDAQRGMEERAHRIACELKISSDPGAGTTVSCRVPAHAAYGDGARSFRSWLRNKFARPRADDH